MLRSEPELHFQPIPDVRFVDKTSTTNLIQESLQMMNIEYIYIELNFNREFVYFYWPYCMLYHTLIQRLSDVVLTGISN